MAVNNDDEMSWSSTARHCRLPSTQMSPPRNRSRNASSTADSQMRRCSTWPLAPLSSTASRQTGRRKLTGRLFGQVRPPPAYHDGGQQLDGAQRRGRRRYGAELEGVEEQRPEPAQHGPGSGGERRQVGLVRACEALSFGDAGGEFVPT